MIIALLSWFNESPAMLANAVGTLTFADHLIAVDGAYALYPEAQAKSPSDQADVIRAQADMLGIGLTLHQPAHPWAGNEVEKRTTMFRLAELLGTENDWLYIVDADEQVTNPHEQTVRQALAETTLLTAEVTYWWHRPHKTPNAYPFPSPLREQQGITKFFRNLPGLHCQGAHYRYVAGDGTVMWNPNGIDATEPLDVRTVRVQHRNQERDLWRQQEAKTYYDARDTLKIEATA